MKTSEVKKLKITALNIRSILTEKNKRIAKLEKKKIRLVRRQGLQAERATAEGNLETKSNKPAIIWENEKGQTQKISYSELHQKSPYLLLEYLHAVIPVDIEYFAKSQWS